MLVTDVRVFTIGNSAKQLANLFKIIVEVIFGYTYRS
jgi:hypothetical protein